MIQNLKTTFEECGKLQRSAKRHINQAHKRKVEAFKSTLVDLFHTAYQDILKNINEEDRQFFVTSKKQEMSWLQRSC